MNNNISVAVASCEEMNGNLIFKMELKQGNNKWTLTRNLKDFEEQHCLVSKQLSRGAPIDTPKKYCEEELSDAPGKIQYAMDRYLQDWLQVPGVAENPQFLNFIESRQALPQSCQISSPEKTQIIEDSDNIEQINFNDGFEVKKMELDAVMKNMRGTRDSIGEIEKLPKNIQTTPLKLSHSSKLRPSFLAKLQIKTLKEGSLVEDEYVGATEDPIKKCVGQATKIFRHYTKEVIYYNDISQKVNSLLNEVDDLDKQLTKNQRHMQEMVSTLKKLQSKKEEIFEIAQSGNQFIFPSSMLQESSKFY